MKQKLTGGAVGVVGHLAVGDLLVVFDLTREPDTFVELSGRRAPADRDGPFVVPRTFKATVTDPPGACRRRVTLVIEAEAEGVRVVQVAIDVEEGAAMTEEDVRSFDLNRYFAAAMTVASQMADSHTGRWRETAGGLSAVTDVWRRGSVGRRPMSDETLMRVAELYQEAVASGVPTARYISEGLEEQPSISSTRRWIMLARQRGFLPPVGSSGEEG